MYNSKNKLVFSELPGFSAFILENHLEEYTRTILRYSIEEEIPVLKLFSHFSEEELFSLSLQPNIDFLTVFVENRVEAFINDSIQAYRDDKMEEIGQGDILVEDLTIGAFVRRKTFRHLIPKYTQELEKMSAIMEEVDRFVVASEGASFKALIDIQTEKLNQANAKLSQTKEELLELQELADMGSFVWNLEDGSSSFTPGIMHILGIRETMETPDFMKKIHPEDVESVQTALDIAFSSDGKFECEYRYLVDGEEKYVWSRGIVTFSDGKPSQMKGTVMDISNKHKLIRELKESEGLSKQSQALTHIGNWSWEIGKDVVTWSDEMYRIYGLLPQSEVINFDRFISLIHPDDRENRIREIQESLATLEARDYLLRIVNPDGTLKILRGKGEVIAENGTVVKLVGTCQDITKEHHLTEELRQQSRELEQLNFSLANKNTDLERINRELESFNYVASHDLQEPLRKIQIFTGRILEEGYGQFSDDIADYFEKITNSTSRMRLLIEDLLKFSRTTTVENVLRPVNLNELVKEVMHAVSQSSEERKVNVQVGELPVIEGIPFQLHQLFHNLISNSIKYAKQDADPEIQLSSRVISGDMLNIGYGKSDLYNEIRFKDNGIGFEQDNAEKIFDLFQRLHGKDEYSGTGIGLAICKKIAYNHKGIITAKGYPGEGSEFYIYFPA